MSTTRGQTTIDFAIGMAVFLSVVLFVFAFVPGILSPFDLSGEEEPAVSNQIADSLTQGQLGSPQDPYVLDRYCTIAFFDDDPAPADCNYDSTTLTEQFDLANTQRVRVVVSDTFDDGDRTPLCWVPEDGSDPPQLVSEDDSECDDDDVRLVAGEDPPPSGVSTVTARRVVSLHGQTVTMEVLVW